MRLADKLADRMRTGYRPEREDHDITMRIQPPLTGRILRRLTISATLTAAALGAAAVTAMAATAAPAAGLPVATPTTARSPVSPAESAAPGMVADVFGVQAFCTPVGVIYTVIANRIHIRNAPDGSWLYPIQKNRWWDDNFTLSGHKGTFNCVSDSPRGDQYWYPGFANYKPSERGWIGGEYLNNGRFYY
jgi:hypothetical protein